MAEAFAAVGLAASIITFVDATNKILDRLREFHSTTQEIPECFQDIHGRLPLIIDVMTRIKSRKDGSLTADTQEKLLRTVDGCNKQVALLNKLIEKMLPTLDDSQWRRTLKAIESIRRGKDVMAIQETLGRYERTLTLHFSQWSGASTAIAERGSAYYELPSSQVSQFVERAELLKEIEASFADTSRNTPQKVVLLGMGGSGKTQIALKYCQVARLSKRFQAIFWIEASSENTVSRGFESIAAKISNSERVFDNIESKIAFVKDTLGQWRSPWLMVFDNYDQPGEFKNLSDFFPQGQTGAMLFTSRNTDSKRLGVTITVTQMTEDEGLELLLRQSELGVNRDNTVEGKKIIKKLGCLPLAIDQAGAYIATRKLPLQLFAKHYGERKEAVLKHTPSLWEYRRRLGEDKDQTLLSVFTTWELSFQQIGKDENERAMIGHFLSLSAFFDVTNINENLFRSHLALSDEPPQWMELFAMGNVWEQHKYQDVMVELQRLSLLQSMDIGSTDSRFSLHPLVADWLRLRVDQRDRQKYTIEAIRILTNYVDAQDQDILPLQMKLDILSHIEMCLQNDKDYSLTNIASLGTSAHTFASLYWNHGRYQEAEAMYQRALAGKEKVLGPDHLSTLSTVNNLGILYSDQSRTAEAEAMFQRALVGREKALGPGHQSTLSTVNNLGILYRDQSRTAEAETMFHRALAGTKKAFGPDHPSTLTTVNNLGNLYRDQGRTAEAETMYQRALVGTEKALGPDHPSTLTTVNNLGNLYRNQSRMAESEAMYQQALAGREKALGPDHLLTLDTVTNLATLYNDQSRTTEAEVMYQRALVGTEKVLGPDHPSTLIIVNNIGNLYEKQGRAAEAEMMYQQALAGTEKARGPDHPSTLSTVNNLGVLYSDQGRTAEAEVMFQRALAGKEKSLGPDHPSTLSTVNDLGILYSGQGRTTEAEAMYQRALVGRDKLLGLDHPSTLHTVKNLEILYSNQGRMAEAEAIHQRAYTSA
ncbi:MAG: hypothetical protein M1813_003758 [Trichoglossum hirsutum]|jgi:tetratricopeptide (TPR) repeat protein|nr:MAG: hypothetical protein M1813_003758 [Trichoglossum hirsutum]